MVFFYKKKKKKSLRFFLLTYFEDRGVKKRKSNKFKTQFSSHSKISELKIQQILSTVNRLLSGTKKKTFVFVFEIRLQMAFLRLTIPQSSAF